MTYSIFRVYTVSLSQTVEGVMMQNLRYITLKSRIDGTPRLLIIPFFATLPNLIQPSPFINSREFWQPPLYSRLPVY